jgi:hypothetical protein
VLAASDLATAVPECRKLSVLLSRAIKTGLLWRVCKDVYLYPVRDYPAGHLLFHAEARLRAAEFNYISLEKVLSDASVIPPRHSVAPTAFGRKHGPSAHPKGCPPILDPAKKRDVKVLRGLGSGYFTAIKRRSIDI